MADEDRFYRNDNYYERRNKGWNVLWLIAGIAAVAVLVIVALPLFDNLNLPNDQSRLERITDNPSEFVGRDVRVTGEIRDIIGSRAFTVNSNGVLSEQVLVISRNPLTPVGGSGVDDFLYNTNDRVSINGTLRTFDTQEIEEELGIELVDEQFQGWEGRPVIVADTVEMEL